MLVATNIRPSTDTNLAISVIFLLLISSTHAQDEDAFLRRRFSAGQRAPDDEFCDSLAATCPYLRSATARPAASPDIPIPIYVDFLPINFIGIDDREQQ